MYGPEGGEVKVTILSGNSNVGSEITIRDAEAVIGRAPDCQVVLDHPTVSARHARLFLRDGQYFVEDTQSTNGTAVNGLAISGPVGLKSGDLIQVGEVHVLFQQDAAAASDGATMVYGAASEGAGQPVGMEGPTVVEGSTEGATMVADPSSMSGQTSVMPAEGGDYSSGGETMVSAAQTYDEPPTATADSAEYGGGLNLEKQESEPAEPSWQEQSQSSPQQDASEEAAPASGAPIDDTHALLGALSSRATDLQSDIQAVTESMGKLEARLATAEQERDDARNQLQTLASSLDDVVQSTGDRKAALGAGDVLSNLDGLVAQPNDLALLVNVSRDAGRYANLIRLTDEVVDKLKGLSGNNG